VLFSAKRHGFRKRERKREREREGMKKIASWKAEKRNER
jgi:hypothetical protein